MAGSRVPDETLLGRGRELRLLTSLLESTASRHGAIALVVGEAGIGKSRLAADVAARAEALGAVVAWGRCWDGEDAPAYWPWAQIINGLDPSTGDDSDSPAFSRPAGDPFSVAETVLRNVADLDRPVVLVLDDLHAADEPSLHVLRAIAQQAETRSLLIVGTYREEDVELGSVAARILVNVGRMGELVDLRGLDEKETAACFEQVAGHPPPPSLASSVYRASAGNPFFVRELARQTSSDTGIQRPDRSLGFRVPAGAREIITQRLDHLPEEVRSLLRVAAVIGYEFDLRVLERVTSIEGDRLLDTLTDARRLGFLDERSSLGRYGFSHVLVREELYEELPASQRARLHADAARGIEALYPEDRDARVGELAQHLFKAGAAGDLAKALDYASRAGRRALESGEIDDASRHLYRALKIAESLGSEKQVRDELATALAAADAAARETAEDLTAGEETTRNSFVREGEYWAIDFAGVTSRLKDSKGLRYLAELLRHPGRELLALDLVASTGATRTDGKAALDAGLTSAAGDAGEVLDAEAKARYSERLEELRDEIDEAESFNDPERAARAKEEMDFLTRELAAGVGLGGRSRKASSATDRARMSVTRALRTAIDKIAEANPALGRHLEATTKTGTYVSYTPDPRVPVAWEL